MTPSIPITKALRLLQELRRVEPPMHSSEAEVLFLVARRPGITQREAMIETGMSKSAISRHIEALGDREGRGYVVAREGLLDRRFHALHLTETGAAFVRGLTAFL